MTYEYKHVDVVRVIDGDTVELDIDLGNHTKWRNSFRLLGIDTPEHGMPKFDEATEYLRKLLKDGVSRCQTTKPDKYGRWLVDLWTASSAGGEFHINTLILQSGLAKPYFGGAKE
jgi:micrococcal nuclease